MKGYLRPGGLAETARQLGREALAEVAGFLHHCGRGAWLGWRWRLMEMATKRCYENRILRQLLVFISLWMLNVRLIYGSKHPMEKHEMT